MVRGSNPGRGEYFRTHPHRPCGPSSFLCVGYRVIPGGKAAGVRRWSPTPSSAEVKERKELYFSTPARASWSLLGWTVTSVSTKLYVFNIACTFQDWKLIQHVVDQFSYGALKRGRGFYFRKCYSTLFLTAAPGKRKNESVYWIKSFQTY
jgi:hypothetical protein